MVRQVRQVVFAGSNCAGLEGRGEVDWSTRIIPVVNLCP